MDAGYLSIIFSCGVIAQAIFLLRKNSLSLKFIGLVIGSFFAALFFDKYHDLAFAYPLYFALGMAMFFKKEVVEWINEGSVFAYTVLFWTLFITSDQSSTIRSSLLLIISIVPTIYATYVAFTDNKLSKKSKIFLYAWYLFVAVIFIFSFINLDAVPKKETFDKLVKFDEMGVFFTGMGFLFLVMNGSFIFDLIPHKGHSISDVIEHANLLASRYTDEQLSSTQAFLILLIICGGGILNNYLNLVSKTAYIGMWITIIPMIVASMKNISTNRRLKSSPSARSV